MKSLRRHLALVTGAAIVTVLTGCAMAPGMSYSSRVSGAGTIQSDPLASTRPGAPKADGMDALPPNSLVEINGELISKQEAERPKGIPTGVTALFAKPAPYALGPGDILSIIVWDHPELNMPEATGSGGQDATGSNSVVSGYTIDSGGKVQYAYIGPVKLAGLTEMEARDLMTTKLSKYIRNPQVTLRITAYRSKRVYVDGEVRNPGLQTLNDMTMTLPEAINRAGGFTTNGDRSQIAVTRSDETVVVNIPDLIAKGTNPNNIVLRDGDLVRVFSSNDSKISVLGEVEHPGSFVLNNGRMSLSQALGDAGGVNQSSGDASQIFVVRNRESGQPTVFHLDASSPTAMATADSFDLKPDDVVFVDASALVRWARVIGLILPSTQAAATSRALGY
ncbi:polysaccharide biosynthesis/export family protein [Paraburkholderia humisilvae]|uniref:polysaccharide biosynthesis/export family protein n=1 Tax=Paraburkholderia humisilvae TaxID=627669 RepID=UPI0035E47A73